MSCEYSRHFKKQSLEMDVLAIARRILLSFVENNLFRKKLAEIPFWANYDLAAGQFFLEFWKTAIFREKSP